MTEDEMIEARQRARDWREMMEEWCPNGGALFGDEQVIQLSDSLSDDRSETKTHSTKTTRRKSGMSSAQSQRA
jgi:hypothetical protein